MTSGDFYFGIMIGGTQEDFSNATGLGFALYATSLSNTFRISQCTQGFLNSSSVVSGTALATSANGLVSRTEWMAVQFEWFGVLTFSPTFGLSIRYDILIRAGTGTDFSALPIVVSVDSVLNTNPGYDNAFSLLFANTTAPGCFLVGPCEFEYRPSAVG
jgi:hypothetical protein